MGELRLQSVLCAAHAARRAESSYPLHHQFGWQQNPVIHLRIFTIQPGSVQGVRQVGGDRVWGCTVRWVVIWLSDVCSD